MRLGFLPAWLPGVGQAPFVAAQVLRAKSLTNEVETEWPLLAKPWESQSLSFSSWKLQGWAADTDPVSRWRHVRLEGLTGSQRLQMHPGIIPASLFSYAQHHSLISLTTNPGVRLCLEQIPSRDNAGHQPPAPWDPQEKQGLHRAHFN